MKSPQHNKEPHQQLNAVETNINIGRNQIDDLTSDLTHKIEESRQSVVSTVKKVKQFRTPVLIAFGFLTFYFLKKRFYGRPENIAV